MMTTIIVCVSPKGGEGAVMLPYEVAWEVAGSRAGVVPTADLILPETLAAVRANVLAHVRDTYPADDYDVEIIRET